MGRDRGLKIGLALVIISFFVWSPVPMFSLLYEGFREEVVPPPEYCVKLPRPSVLYKITIRTLPFSRVQEDRKVLPSEFQRHSEAAVVPPSSD